MDKYIIPIYSCTAISLAKVEIFVKYAEDNLVLTSYINLIAGMC